MKYLIFIGFFFIPFLAKSTDVSSHRFKDVIVTEQLSQPDHGFNKPYTVTDYDRKTIKERGFSRFQDVYGEIPNLNLMDAGANGFLDRSNIRGLLNSPIYTQPAITLYVDDVPYSSAFSYINQLTMTDEISVYRGPQGARFGKNSYGGAINIVTQRPGNQLQGSVSVDKANYDRTGVNGYLSGALLNDQLYFNLAGAFSSREGYLNNTTLNTRTDDRQHISGKSSIIWTPNKQWDFNLSFAINDFNDGAFRIVPLDSDNRYETSSNIAGEQKQKSHTESLRIAYKGPSFDLLSVTALRSWKVSPYIFDADLSALPIVKQKVFMKQQQLTQEIRLRPLNGHSDWDWLFGLFFSDNGFDGQQLNSISNLNEQLSLRKLDEQAYASFAQISFNGFQSMQISFDLRLDYVNKKIDRHRRYINGLETSFSENTDDFFASPKLTIDYQFSPQIFTYASTGLAFKPGGFSPLSETHPAYKKEDMWASEVGIKTSWNGDNIQSNITGFYYEIDNYQLEDGFTPTDYTIVNADEVVSFGAEFEFQARFFKTLQFETNFGYTHITFKEHTAPFSGQVYNGKTVPYIPEFNLLTALQYKHPQGYFVRVESLWTGKTYFNEANSSRFAEKDYAVFNARLGYENKYFAVYGYVKNISDNQYFTQKFAFLNAGTPSEPRTYGTTFNIKF